MTRLLIVNLFLFALLFILGLFILRLIPHNLRKFFIAGFCAISFPGLLYTLYYLHFFDDWVLFYSIRSCVIFNYYPSLLGLAAASLALMLRPWYRIAFIVLLLLPFVIIPFSKQLLNPLDVSSLTDNWEEDVCRQSTPSTCGPASAATLLKHLSGKKLSEAQIAKGALTTGTGTEAWYLAQYIKHQGCKINILTKMRSPVSPSIAGIDMGGIGHFVVVFGVSDKGVEIADPLDGKKSLVDPRSLRFTGFYLHITPK